ncbi:MAG: ABC transporter ATP-binding protein [Phycisphaeraceae bacterium]|nr:MAG: ABC transporter ATP-binding protein [Phycisphaeraceae bacterium]
MEPGPILEVADLRVEFGSGRALLAPSRSRVVAVDGVSFNIARGETLGVVGESGSGKTTLGRAVLRLIEPTSGSVCFDGTDVRAASGATLRRMRRRMQIIFQDPAASLDPRMRVAAIVAEPLHIHGLVKTRSEGRKAAEELLERCGMPPSSASRYPHQFSGGQRQRIAIARALALKPGLIVCDEPTSALDVSVQAQIINLLQDLQDELGLSYLFISHDMAVVSHVCHRIAVMRAGRFEEIGPRDHIIHEPREAYTRALLEAVPRMRRGGSQNSELGTQVG